jgi:hypothetical protein
MRINRWRAFLAMNDKLRAPPTNDKLVKFLYIKCIKIEFKLVAIRSKGKSHVSTRHDNGGSRIG